MHPAAFLYVTQTITKYPLPAEAKVLEIGSRVVNGSIRSIFDLIPGVQYVGTDIAPGPGVDRVADGATLTLPTPADVVVSCEVLEHTASAEALVANTARLLTPGGRVILTAAGQGDGWAREPHSARDGGPLQADEFYQNISADTLTAWLTAAGYTAIEVQANAHAKDIYATAVTPEAVG